MITRWIREGKTVAVGRLHSGDHDAEYHGDLTEQHVRPLHDLASDSSYADCS